MANNNDITTAMYQQFAGPELLAAFLSSYLCGAILILTLYYRQTYPKDRLIIKAIVFISFAANIIQTGGISAGLYQSLVQEPASIGTRGFLFTGVQIAIIVVPVPVLLAKVLFAERCYWVSKNVYVRKYL